jgi:hypothetical protein
MADILSSPTQIITTPETIMAKISSITHPPYSNDTNNHGSDNDTDKNIHDTLHAL